MLYIIEFIKQVKEKNKMQGFAEHLIGFFLSIKMIMWKAQGVPQ